MVSDCTLTPRSRPGDVLTCSSLRKVPAMTEKWYNVHIRYPPRTQVKEKGLFFGVVLLNMWPTSTKNRDRQISKDAIERNNCRQVSGDKRSLLDGSLPMLVRHLNRNQRTRKVTWRSYRTAWNHSQSKCSHHLAYLSQEISKDVLWGWGTASLWWWRRLQWEQTDGEITGVQECIILPSSENDPQYTLCLPLPAFLSLWVTLSAFCFLFQGCRLVISTTKGGGSRWAWPKPPSNNRHHHGVRLVTPEGEGENTCMCCSLYSFIGDSVWRC